MNLTGISLENFKCFADEQSVAIAPLTLVFGKNNSGKSTLLQSLLVLRQSLDAPTGYGPRLNLNGPLYDFGSFHDVVHQHRASSHIGMTFHLESAPNEVISFLESEPDRWSGSIRLEFSSDEPSPPRLVRVEVQTARSLPLEIRRGIGRGGPYEMYIGGRKVGKESPLTFRLPVGQFLPLIGGWRTLPGKSAPIRARLFARQTIQGLEGVLHGLRAVGAFRQRPERRYEYRGGVPGQPDLSGAYAVDAVIEDALSRRANKSLLPGLNHWLRLVGRIRLLPIRQISKVARLFELRLRDTDSGRWANFSDVGFGIGQAFPVIVEGLRTEPGQTFLIQEPEIHLHPDAQLAMADFLVALARSGRRVIAETHSEHILLRVRRLIAKKGPGALKREDVSLLYVDKHPSGRSHVTRLQVDELGQISKWPEGFMEDAARERLALLRSMSEKATDKRPGGRDA